MGRLGRLLLPALFVVSGYYALFGGEYSVFEVRALRHDVEEARAELGRLEAENRELQARADSLEHDPWTIERLAREEHGLVGEGEEVIRITRQTLTRESREAAGDAGR